MPFREDLIGFRRTASSLLSLLSATLTRESYNPGFELESDRYVMGNTCSAPAAQLRVRSGQDETSPQDQLLSMDNLWPVARLSECH